MKRLFEGKGPTPPQDDFATDDNLDFLEMRVQSADPMALVDLVIEAQRAVHLMAEKGIGFNETRLRAALACIEKGPVPTLSEDMDMLPAEMVDLVEARADVSRSIIRPKDGPRR